MPVKKILIITIIIKSLENNRSFQISQTQLFIHLPRFSPRFSLPSLSCFFAELLTRLSIITRVQSKHTLRVFLRSIRPQKIPIRTFRNGSFLALLHEGRKRRKGTLSDRREGIGTITKSVSLRVTRSQLSLRLYLATDGTSRDA